MNLEILKFYLRISDIVNSKLVFSKPVIFAIEKRICPSELKFSGFVADVSFVE